MILNEDFFNDIEIKDDVLTAEEPAEKYVEQYNEKTSRELIEHNMSESEMVLRIDIFKFPEEFDIWHRIECMMKRLKYMLNIYNINISEPFVTYRHLYFDILKHKQFPDKKYDYTIIQHEGCNLYLPEDKLREHGPDKVIMDEPYEVLFVFLDKKLPVFKTAMSAYNFVIGLDECFWKDVTDPKGECFRRCGFYDINDVYMTGSINSYSDNNSYVNNDGNQIYKSVLNIVSKELAEQLENIKLSKLANEQLKTEDVKNIIKLTEQ